MSLVVKNLRIEYPNWFREYSFELQERQRLAIRGASGIGKSSLLLALAGFIKPVAGEVRWRGIELLKQAPDKRPVSMLFQDDNLFEHLSVMENLKLGLSRRTIEEELPKAIEQLGLSDHLYKRPAALSGGQRQRVGLIRTLLRPEPLILLDEPFAELDSQTRAIALNFTIEATESKDKTLLMITHQEEDIAALATQTLQL